MFKENRLAKGTFVALGRKLALKDITVPTYLLAGQSDDITTEEQVFNAEKLIGTPSSAIIKKLAPGGHIGLFMGQRTLAEIWIADRSMDPGILCVTAVTPRLGEEAVLGCHEASEPSPCLLMQALEGQGDALPPPITG